MQKIIGGIYLYSPYLNSEIKSDEKRESIIIVVNEKEYFIFSLYNLKQFMNNDCITNYIVNNYIEKVCENHSHLYLTSSDFVDEKMFETGYLGQITTENLTKFKQLD